MAKLQTDTPEQLTYSNGLLTLTVLGGVKLEGLDRLRVTLKIELPDSPQPPLRHNLDLYNDTQVEKLVRRTAEAAGDRHKHYSCQPCGTYPGTGTVPPGRNKAAGNSATGTAINAGRAGSGKGTPTGG